jgi:hypothetical protein
MPAQPSQPGTRASSIRRRIGYTQPDLRVSDAERADVADRLGKHYGDGRLDQAEFDERVDQAMKAKTQSDLSGLFDDLPLGEEDEELPLRRPRRRPNHRLLLIALVVVVVASLGSLPTLAFHPGWLLIGFLAVVILSLARSRDHHRDRHDHPSDPPHRP